MFKSTLLVTSGLFSLGVGAAPNLWVSHYSGTISYLSLQPKLDDAYDLSVVTNTTACGSMPSWLSLDASTSTLSCSNENYFSGSISTFTTSSTGDLSDSVSQPAPPSAVNNAIYRAPNNDTLFVAQAHYNTGQVSVFSLPLDPQGSALAIYNFTLDAPGPDPRQTSSHPHQILIDPSGEFVIVPDLGGDLLRVFAIQPDGGLRSCGDSYMDWGLGPRHGAFWSSADAAEGNATMLYVANELDNSVTRFNITYTVGRDEGPCIQFKQDQLLTPYPADATMADGTKVSEVRVENDMVYVSIRDDGHFGAQNDSIAVISLATEGDVEGVMTFDSLVPSGGKSPRTIALSASGGFLAIGDQTTSEVVVLSRNTATGELGDEVARVSVGVDGTAGGEDGLSSVIWDE